MAYDITSPVSPEPDREPEKIDAGQPEEAADISDLMDFKKKTEKALDDKEQAINIAKQGLPEIEKVMEKASTEMIEDMKNRATAAQYKRMIAQIISYLDSNPKSMVLWRGWIGKELLAEIEEVLNTK